MTATLTIDADEREALHGMLLRRLTLLPDYEGIFAERDGLTVADLYLALGDELCLLDEVGLDFKIERSSVELAMPVAPHAKRGTSASHTKTTRSAGSVSGAASSPARSC
jgi:hypothetical protein